MAADSDRRAPEAPEDRTARRMQGLQTLLERVAGGSLESLARKYQTRPDVLRPLLDEKLRDEIVESLRTQILQDLAPMAVAVLEARLKMGDLEAAKYLLDNFGLAKRPAQSLKVQPVAPPASDLESYRLERQTRRYQAPGNRLITPGDQVN